MVINLLKRNIRLCARDPNGKWAMAYQMKLTKIIPHCLENTQRAEIVDDLKPQEEDYVIKKTAFSMLLGDHRQKAEETFTKFANKNPKINNLIVTGTATNVCVFFTCDALFWFKQRGTVLPRYRLVIPVDSISEEMPSPQTKVTVDCPLWSVTTYYSAILTTSERAR